MGKTHVVHPAVISLMAELILDESLRKFQEERLYQKIDTALENKDQTTFLKLTSELKRLKSFRTS